jgi:hypothetical protein
MVAPGVSLSGRSAPMACPDPPSCQGQRRTLPITARCANGPRGPCVTHPPQRVFAVDGCWHLRGGCGLPLLAHRHQVLMAYPSTLSVGSVPGGVLYLSGLPDDFLGHLLHTVPLLPRAHQRSPPRLQRHRWPPQRQLRWLGARTADHLPAPAPSVPANKKTSLIGIGLREGLFFQTRESFF